MKEVYEMLGRKEAELQTLNAEYDKLLTLLAQVLSGEIEFTRVTVNLPGRCWSIHDTASPPIPAH